jgi:hypothetical protein
MESQVVSDDDHDASKVAAVYEPPHVSRLWGDFFQGSQPTDDTGSSSTSSFWAQFVHTHSHLVVPCLSVLSQLATSHAFDTHQRFHPKPKQCSSSS